MGQNCIFNTYILSFDSECRLIAVFIQWFVRLNIFCILRRGKVKQHAPMEVHIGDKCKVVEVVDGGEDDKGAEEEVLVVLLFVDVCTEE